MDGILTQGAVATDMPNPLTAACTRQRVPPRYLGYVLALFSTATIATAFVISKAVLNTINPESFNVYWYTAAAVYALIYGRLSGNPARRTTLHQYWKPLLSIGVINALSMMLFFSAIQMTNPAIISFLGRISTLFTVLLGIIILGERLGRREWVGAAVVLAGALLITYRADAVMLKVFFIALGSSFLYSCTIIIAKQAVASVSPLTLTLARSGGTAFTMLFLTLVTGRLQVPALDMLAIIIVGALGGPLVSHLLLYRALALVDASKVSLIGATQPLFVMLYSLALFGTLPLEHQIAGGLLSMGGVAILLSARNKA
jgi:drug/metabolite transporter (DMT)-like permease